MTFDEIPEGIKDALSMHVASLRRVYLEATIQLINIQVNDMMKDDSVSPVEFSGAVDLADRIIKSMYTAINLPDIAGAEQRNATRN